MHEKYTEESCYAILSKQKLANSFLVQWAGFHLDQEDEFIGLCPNSQTMGYYLEVLQKCRALIESEYPKRLARE